MPELVEMPNMPPVPPNPQLVVDVVNCHPLILLAFARGYYDGYITGNYDENAYVLDDERHGLRYAYRVGFDAGSHDCVEETYPPDREDDY